MKELLKELEPFIYTDLDGNKTVKEDDIADLACNYSLSPSDLGRLHEALKMFQVKVVEYSPEAMEQSFKEILLAFSNANHATDEVIDDYSSQQKERLVESIEKLVPRLLQMRDELKGKPTSYEVPTWDCNITRTRTIGVGQGGTKGVITTEMRDYVWALVKKNKHRIHTQELASDISQNTGMSNGSAFIYVSIIGNLLKGQDNTRTMKFGDLIFYLERIKAECSSIEYQNALNSIERSLPYWEQKLTGSNFGQKARQLLAQLKRKEGL